MNVLKQGIGFETVQVLVRGALDAQGKPTYAAPAAIKARVVREATEVIQADGSTIKSMATLWVDAAQSPLPHEQDHLQLDAGATLVTVIEFMERRNLQGMVDHVRVKVRVGG